MFATFLFNIKLGQWTMPSPLADSRCFISLDNILICQLSRNHPTLVLKHLFSWIWDMYLIHMHKSYLKTDLYYEKFLISFSSNSMMFCFLFRYVAILLKGALFWPHLWYFLKTQIIKITQSIIHAGVALQYHCIFPFYMLNFKFKSLISPCCFSLFEPDLDWILDYDDL